MRATSFKSIRLAMHLGITGCLLLASLPQASGASMILKTDDDPKSDLLAKSASATLDTDAALEDVLRDLAAGRKYMSDRPSSAKRGPWRKIGRAAKRIAKYGPLAGVVSHKKNMKTSTKVLIGVGAAAATVGILYVITLNKAEDAIVRVAGEVAGE